MANNYSAERQPGSAVCQLLKPVGCWLLAVGCWLLAVGDYLLSGGRARCPAEGGHSVIPLSLCLQPPSWFMM